jgi:hypothetical protein
MIFESDFDSVAIAGVARTAAVVTAAVLTNSRRVTERGFLDGIGGST